jgi:hypothetical protein
VVLIQAKKDGIYSVVVGTMHEQANLAQRVIYKPEWFYKHLPMVQQRISKNHVVCEYAPMYAGYNDDNKLRIRGENAIAQIKGLQTWQKDPNSEMYIVAQLSTIGPHYALMDSLLRNDPTATGWEFRLRCLSSPAEGRRLIHQVTKVITWDLFLK